MARLLAACACGVGSCPKAKPAVPTPRVAMHNAPYMLQMLRLIGPHCCRLINIVPPVPEIRKIGPPPLTGPSAITCPPSTRTLIPGKSDTILRILSDNSFCARMVTPTLDGMNTVMSPLPVERNESAIGLPASRLAKMLPIAVETRTPPEMLASCTPPPPLSQLTPCAEPTCTGPAEFLAVTQPCACPTSIGPPPVEAITADPARRMRI